MPLLVLSMLLLFSCNQQGSEDVQSGTFGIKITKIYGDRQGLAASDNVQPEVTYAKPLKIKLIGADGSPMPGMKVYWTFRGPREGARILIGSTLTDTEGVAFTDVNAPNDFGKHVVIAVAVPELNLTSYFDLYTPGSKQVAFRFGLYTTSAGVTADTARTPAADRTKYAGHDPDILADSTNPAYATANAARNARVVLGREKADVPFGFVVELQDQQGNLVQNLPPTVYHLRWAHASFPSWTGESPILPDANQAVTCVFIKGVCRLPLLDDLNNKLNGANAIALGATFQGYAPSAAELNTLGLGTSNSQNIETYAQFVQRVTAYTPKVEPTVSNPQGTPEKFGGYIIKHASSQLKIKDVNGVWVDNSAADSLSHDSLFWVGDGSGVDSKLEDVAGYPVRVTLNDPLKVVAASADGPPLWSLIIDPNNPQGSVIGNIGTKVYADFNLVADSAPIEFFAAEVDRAGNYLKTYYTNAKPITWQNANGISISEEWGNHSVTWSKLVAPNEVSDIISGNLYAFKDLFDATTFGSGQAGDTELREVLCLTPIDNELKRIDVNYDQSNMSSCPLANRGVRLGVDVCLTNDQLCSLNLAFDTRSGLCSFPIAVAEPQMSSALTLDSSVTIANCPAERLSESAGQKVCLKYVDCGFTRELNLDSLKYTAWTSGIGRLGVKVTGGNIPASGFSGESNFRVKAGVPDHLRAEPVRTLANNGSGVIQEVRDGSVEAGVNTKIEISFRDQRGNIANQVGGNFKVRAQINRFNKFNDPNITPEFPATGAQPTIIFKNQPRFYPFNDWIRSSQRDPALTVDDNEYWFKTLRGYHTEIVDGRPVHTPRVIYWDGKGADFAQAPSNDCETLAPGILGHCLALQSPMELYGGGSSAGSKPQQFVAFSEGNFVYHSSSAQKFIPGDGSIIHINSTEDADILTGLHTWQQWAGSRDLSLSFFGGIEAGSLYITLRDKNYRPYIHLQMERKVFPAGDPLDPPVCSRKKDGSLEDPADGNCAELDAEPFELAHRKALATQNWSDYVFTLDNAGKAPEFVDDPSKVAKNGIEILSTRPHYINLRKESADLVQRRGEPAPTTTKVKRFFCDTKKIIRKRVGGDPNSFTSDGLFTNTCHGTQAAVGTEYTEFLDDYNESLLPRCTISNFAQGSHEVFDRGPIEVRTSIITDGSRAPVAAIKKVDENQLAIDQQVCDVLVSSSQGHVYFTYLEDREGNVIDYDLSTPDFIDPIPTSWLGNVDAAGDFSEDLVKIPTVNIADGESNYSLVADNDQVILANVLDKYSDRIYKDLYDPVLAQNFPASGMVNLYPKKKGRRLIEWVSVIPDYQAPDGSTWAGRRIAGKIGLDVQQGLAYNIVINTEVDFTGVLNTNTPPVTGDKDWTVPFADEKYGKEFTRLPTTVDHNRISFTSFDRFGNPVEIPAGTEIFVYIDFDGVEVLGAVDHYADIRAQASAASDPEITAAVVGPLVGLPSNCLSNNRPYWEDVDITSGEGATLSIVCPHANTIMPKLTGWSQINKQRDLDNSNWPGRILQQDPATGVINVVADLLPSYTGPTAVSDNNANGSSAADDLPYEFQAPNANDTNGDGFENDGVDYDGQYLFKYTLPAACSTNCHLMSFRFPRAGTKFKVAGMVKLPTEQGVVRKAYTNVYEMTLAAGKFLKQEIYSDTSGLEVRFEDKTADYGANLARTELLNSFGSDTRYYYTKFFKLNPNLVWKWEVEEEEEFCMEGYDRYWNLIPEAVANAPATDYNHFSSKECNEKGISGEYCLGCSSKDSDSCSTLGGGILDNPHFGNGKGYTNSETGLSEELSNIEDKRFILDDDDQAWFSTLSHPPNVSTLEARACDQGNSDTPCNAWVGKIIAKQKSCVTAKFQHPGSGRIAAYKYLEKPCSEGPGCKIYYDNKVAFFQAEVSHGRYNHLYMQLDREGQGCPVGRKCFCENQFSSQITECTSNIPSYVAGEKIQPQIMLYDTLDNKYTGLQQDNVTPHFNTAYRDTSQFGDSSFQNTSANGVRFLSFGMRDALFADWTNPITTISVTKNTILPTSGFFKFKDGELLENQGIDPAPAVSPTAGYLYKATPLNNFVIMDVAKPVRPASEAVQRNSQIQQQFHTINDYLNNITVDFPDAIYPNVKIVKERLRAEVKAVDQFGNVILGGVGSNALVELDLSTAVGVGGFKFIETDQWQSFYVQGDQLLNLANSSASPNVLERQKMVEAALLGFKDNPDTPTAAQLALTSASDKIKIIKAGQSAETLFTPYGEFYNYIEARQLDTFKIKGQIAFGRAKVDFEVSEAKDPEPDDLTPSFSLIPHRDQIAARSETISNITYPTRFRNNGGSWGNIEIWPTLLALPIPLIGNPAAPDPDFANPPAIGDVPVYGGEVRVVPEVPQRIRWVEDHELDKKRWDYANYRPLEVVDGVPLVQAPLANTLLFDPEQNPTANDAPNLPENDAYGFSVGGNWAVKNNGSVRFEVLDSYDNVAWNRTDEFVSLTQIDIPGVARSVNEVSGAQFQIFSNIPNGINNKKIIKGQGRFFDIKYLKAETIRVKATYAGDGSTENPAMALVQDVNIKPAIPKYVLAILPGQKLNAGVDDISKAIVEDTAAGCGGVCVQQAGVPFTVKVAVLDAGFNVVVDEVFLANVSYKLDITDLNASDITVPVVPVPASPEVNEVGIIEFQVTALTATDNDALGEYDDHAVQPLAGNGLSCTVLDCFISSRFEVAPAAERKMAVVLPGQALSQGKENYADAVPQDPTVQTAGEGFDVSVYLVDKFHNRVGDNSSAISLAINDPANGHNKITVVSLPGKLPNNSVDATRDGLKVFKVFHYKSFDGNDKSLTPTATGYASVNSKNYKVEPNIAYRTILQMPWHTYSGGGYNVDDNPTLNDIANHAGFFTSEGLGRAPLLSGTQPADNWVSCSQKTITVRLLDKYFNTRFTQTSVGGVNKAVLTTTDPYGQATISSASGGEWTEGVTTFVVKSSKVGAWQLTQSSNETVVQRDHGNGEDGDNNSVADLDTGFNAYTVNVGSAGSASQTISRLPGQTFNTGGRTLANAIQGTPDRQTAGVSFSVDTYAVDDCFNLVPTVVRPMQMATNTDAFDTHDVQRNMSAGVVTHTVTHRTANTAGYASAGLLPKTEHVLVVTDATAGTPLTSTNSNDYFVDPNVATQLLVRLPGQNYVNGALNEGSAIVGAANFSGATYATAGVTFPVDVYVVDDYFNVVTTAVNGTHPVNLLLDNSNGNTYDILTQNSYAAGVANYTIENIKQQTGHKIHSTLNASASNDSDGYEIRHNVFTQSIIAFNDVAIPANDLQTHTNGVRTLAAALVTPGGKGSLQKTAGQSFQVTAKVLDAYFNVVKTYTAQPFRIVSNDPHDDDYPDGTSFNNGTFTEGSAAMTVYNRTVGNTRNLVVAPLGPAIATNNVSEEYAVVANVPSKLIAVFDSQEASYKQGAKDDADAVDNILPQVDDGGGGFKNPVVDEAYTVTVYAVDKHYNKTSDASRKVGLNTVAGDANAPNIAATYQLVAGAVDIPVVKNFSATGIARQDVINRVVTPLADGNAPSGAAYQMVTSLPFSVDTAAASKVIAVFPGQKFLDSAEPWHQGVATLAAAVTGTPTTQKIDAPYTVDLYTVDHRYNVIDDDSTVLNSFAITGDPLAQLDTLANGGALITGASKTVTNGHAQIQLVNLTTTIAASDDSGVAASGATGVQHSLTFADNAATYSFENNTSFDIDFGAQNSYLVLFPGEVHTPGVATSAAAVDSANICGTLDGGKAPLKRCYVGNPHEIRLIPVDKRFYAIRDKGNTSLSFAYAGANTALDTPYENPETKKPLAQVYNFDSNGVSTIPSTDDRGVFYRSFDEPTLTVTDGTFSGTSNPLPLKQEQGIAYLEVHTRGADGTSENKEITPTGGAGVDFAGLAQYTTGDTFSPHLDRTFGTSNLPDPVFYAAAYDSFGNIKYNDTSADWAITTGSGKIVGAPSVTSLENAGSIALDLSESSPGNLVITVNSDNIDGGTRTAGTTGNIIVREGGAVTIGLAWSGTPLKVGTPEEITLTARDDDGNIASDYDGIKQYRFTSNAGDGFNHCQAIAAGEILSPEFDPGVGANNGDRVKFSDNQIVEVTFTNGVGTITPTFKKFATSGVTVTAKSVNYDVISGLEILPSLLQGVTTGNNVTVGGPHCLRMRTAAGNGTTHIHSGNFYDDLDGLANPATYTKTLKIDESFTIHAAAYDSYGNYIADHAANWTIEDSLGSLNTPTSSSSVTLKADRIISAATANASQTLTATAVDNVPAADTVEVIVERGAVTQYLVLLPGQSFNSAGEGLYHLTRNATETAINATTNTSTALQAVTTTSSTYNAVAGVAVNLTVIGLDSSFYQVDINNALTYTPRHNFTVENIANGGLAPDGITLPTVTGHSVDVTQTLNGKKIMVMTGAATFYNGGTNAKDAGAKQLNTTNEVATPGDNADYIEISDGGLSALSQKFSVQASPTINHILVRDSANDGGQIISTLPQYASGAPGKDRTYLLDRPAPETQTLYAATYDLYENYIGDQAATWSYDNGTGNSLGNGASATLDLTTAAGTLAGDMTIKAIVNNANTGNVDKSQTTGLLKIRDQGAAFFLLGHSAQPVVDVPYQISITAKLDDASTVASEYAGTKQLNFATTAGSGTNICNAATLTPEYFSDAAGTLSISSGSNVTFTAGVANIWVRFKKVESAKTVTVTPTATAGLTGATSGSLSPTKGDLNCLIAQASAGDVNLTPSKELGPQTIKIATNRFIYSVGYDKYGNHRGNEEVTWSNANARLTLSISIFPYNVVTANTTIGAETITLTSAVAGVAPITVDFTVEKGARQRILALLPGQTHGAEGVGTRAEAIAGTMDPIKAGVPITVTLVATDGRYYAVPGANANATVTLSATSSSPNGTAPVGAASTAMDFAGGNTATFSNAFTLYDSGASSVDLGDQNARVRFAISGLADYTSYIAVSPNDTVDYIKLESSSGGTGTEIGDVIYSTLDADPTFYAIAYDQYGNYKFDDPSTDWAITTGAGAFVGDATDNANEQLDLSAATAGSLVVTGTPAQGSVDTTGTLTIREQGAASYKVTLTGSPKVNVPHTFTITAYKEDGTTVAGDYAGNKTINFSTNAGNGTAICGAATLTPTLPADGSQVNFTAGVGTFQATFKKLQSSGVNLTVASSSTAGLAGGTSANFQVTVGDVNCVKIQTATSNLNSTPGAELDALTLKIGETSDVLYSIAYDAFGNYIGLKLATWLSSGKFSCGTAYTSCNKAAKAIVLTADIIEGSDTITLDHADLAPAGDDSATMTINRGDVAHYVALLPGQSYTESNIAGQAGSAVTRAHVVDGTANTVTTGVPVDVAIVAVDSRYYAVNENTKYFKSTLAGITVAPDNTTSSTAAAATQLAFAGSSTTQTLSSAGTFYNGDNNSASITIQECSDGSGCSVIGKTATTDSIDVTVSNTVGVVKIRSAAANGGTEFTGNTYLDETSDPTLYVSAYDAWENYITDNSATWVVKDASDDSSLTGQASILSFQSGTSTELDLSNASLQAPVVKVCATDTAVTGCTGSITIGEEGALSYTVAFGVTPTVDVLNPITITAIQGTSTTATSYDGFKNINIITNAAAGGGRCGEVSNLAVQFYADAGGATEIVSHSNASVDFTLGVATLYAKFKKVESGVTMNINNTQTGEAQITTPAVPTATVVAGANHCLKLQDGAGDLDGGSPPSLLGNQTKQIGDSFTAYAAGYDKYGNFSENISADWAITNNVATLGATPATSNLVSIDNAVDTGVLSANKAGVTGDTVSVTTGIGAINGYYALLPGQSLNTNSGAGYANATAALARPAFVASAGVPFAVDLIAVDARFNAVDLGAKHVKTLLTNANNGATSGTPTTITSAQATSTSASKNAVTAAATVVNSSDTPTLTVQICDDGATCSATTNTATTETFSVLANSTIASLKIRDGASNAGSEVTTASYDTTGVDVNFYAASYDTYGNYIGEQAATTWSYTSGAGAALSNSAGVTTLDLSAATPGTMTIKAANAGDTINDATGTLTIVEGGAVSYLVELATAGNKTAGGTFDLTITAKDAASGAGSTATAYDGDKTITLSSASAGNGADACGTTPTLTAELPSSATVSFTAGVGTISGTNLKKAETLTDITANNNHNTLNGTLSTVTVVAGAVGCGKIKSTSTDNGHALDALTAQTIALNNNFDAYAHGYDGFGNAVDISAVATWSGTGVLANVPTPISGSSTNVMGLASGSGNLVLSGVGSDVSVAVTVSTGPATLAMTSSSACGTSPSHNCLANNAVKAAFHWNVLGDSTNSWRTAAKTWKSETLNSLNIRGSRPEFPPRAYLIGSSGGLDIIDTMTNELWARFNSGSGLVIDSALGSITSLVAQNGKIYVGMTGGLVIIDFNGDKSYKLTSSTRTAQSSISNRNSSSGWASDTTYPLINSDYIQSLAVIENASYTHVVIGASASVSVLDEEGPGITVDTTVSNVQAVAATSDGDVYFTSDEEALTKTNLALSGGTTYNSEIPGRPVNDMAVVVDGSALDGTLNAIYLAGDKGLITIHEDATTPDIATYSVDGTSDKNFSNVVNFGTATSNSSAKVTLTGDAAMARTDGTLELRFMPFSTFDSSDGTDMQLLVKGDMSASGDYKLFFDQSDGKLKFSIYDGTSTNTVASSATSWNANQWYHVAVSVDGDNGSSNSVLSLHIDAGTAVTDSSGAILSMTNKNLEIGTSFMGAVDEFIVWNNVQTYASVPASENTDTSNTNGIIHMLHFNEASGSSADDAISATDATMTTATWFSTPTLDGTDNTLNAIIVHQYATGAAGRMGAGDGKEYPLSNLLTTSPTIGASTSNSVTNYVMLRAGTTLGDYDSIEASSSGIDLIKQ